MNTSYVFQISPPSDTAGYIATKWQQNSRKIAEKSQQIAKLFFTNCKISVICLQLIFTKFTSAALRTSEACRNSRLAYRAEVNRENELQFSCSFFAILVIVCQVAVSDGGERMEYEHATMCSRIRVEYEHRILCSGIRVEHDHINICSEICMEPWNMST
jgi:hypothetical protein